jgi:predicted GTPase
MAAMAQQTRQAMDEADIIIFIVDGREGLTQPGPRDRGS